jgi:sigma54-dependent transcription regulator
MLTDSEILRRHQIGLGFRLVPLENWRAQMRTGANVLVTGPGEALRAFIQAARSEMREPIRSVAGSSALFLDARTLIFTEADALDAGGQRRLTRWMNEPRNAQTQIISLTSVDLLALVEAGRFDADLFYRLNTIHLKVQDV